MLDNLLPHALRWMRFNQRTFQSLPNNSSTIRNALTHDQLSKFAPTQERDIDGHTLYTCEQSAQYQHIFLLHGGAYVIPALAGHIRMLKSWYQLGFCVSAFDYPLAPNATADETINATLKAYQTLIEAYPNDRILVVGDSAGGGLAISLLQKLRENGLPMPAKTALLSPWLDLELHKAEERQQHNSEVVLHLEGLRRCAEAYAGSRSLDDPLISPVKADLSNLGPMKLWVSDSELFYEDCLTFVERVEAAEGSRCRLKVESGLLHDWPMIANTSKARSTIRSVARYFFKMANSASELK
ncbi:alpha/beta hydrolase [Salinibius halmophilus]|uniref:alpha/beta hydrolase n=1 Tax=Salinibius halmophilus TaxID=1853216 RepID=UPI000E66CB17|nr:alpha/beta hydrolase [Salinibius halmophilus]